MSASIGRSTLSSLRRGAVAPSSSFSSSSLSFGPSLPLLLPSSTTTLSSRSSSHRFYSSKSTLVPSSFSSSSPSSPLSQRSSSTKSSSSKSTSSTSAASEVSSMLADTAGAKRTRDAKTAKSTRDWANLMKNKAGRAQLKNQQIPDVVYYNPDTWISHFRNSLSVMETFKRVQMLFSVWVTTNRDLQLNLGRTEVAEQRLGLIPFTKEWKLQVKNRDLVLSQAQKVYDNFREIEIRCDTEANIEAVTLGLAKKQLTAKHKDPRRNKLFLDATWERTKDHAKPRIISLFSLPIVPSLKVSQRDMLVEFDFQERIVLGQKENANYKIIDQRTKTTVLFEQRNWVEGLNEWKVKVRNVQKDPFGTEEMVRDPEA
ncbi:hypothetical protein BDY24DRAFT_379625 [Mrakia frigida]|uniref:uncharacterized protein n=1 Tax=Mrakia frigida TaxID=29902 RepID=UPI003FCC0A10